MIARKNGFHGNKYEWKNGNLVRIYGLDSGVESILTYDTTIDSDYYVFSRQMILEILALYGYYGKMPINRLVKYSRGNQTQNFSYFNNDKGVTDTFVTEFIIRSVDETTSESFQTRLSWLCP